MKNPLVSLVLLAACARGAAPAPAAEAPAPVVEAPAPVVEAPAPPTAPEAPVNGALSPAGDPHPGSILHVDRIAGREWSVAAADAPQTVAWASLDGAWVPVVKVVLQGAADAREILRYGPEDRFLDATIAPPPRLMLPTPSQPPTPIPTED